MSTRDQDREPLGRLYLNDDGQYLAVTERADAMASTMEDVERAHRRLGHLLSVTACEKCGDDPERREEYRSCTGCGVCEPYQARRHREEEARTNVVEIPQASTANPELVQMLEHLLAKAKAGEAIGLVAAIQLTGREVATAMGGTFNPFLMLGHLEWVKMRLAVTKIGGTLDG